MSDVSGNNMTVYDLIAAHPGGPYSVNIAGPIHALLVAAERLVAAGYTFDQVKDGLALFMECEAKLQEQSRDAEL